MNKYFFCLTLLGSVLFTGCSITSGPEAPKSFTNKLLINGVVDEIKFADMVHFPKLPANKTYNIELTFYTGSTVATYSPSRKYTGVGSYFKFFLWTQDSTIASGTYTIDGAVNKDFSINKALAELNVDWSTGESDFGSFLDGTVVVENLGDGNYIVDMYCTDYEGNPVTAHYEGEFYKI